MRVEPNKTLKCAEQKFRLSNQKGPHTNSKALVPTIQPSRPFKGPRTQNKRPLCQFKEPILRPRTH